MGLCLTASHSWCQVSGLSGQAHMMRCHSPTSLLPLTSPPGSLVSCSARALHGNELGQLWHGAGHQVTFAGWPENCLDLVKLNQTAEQPGLGWAHPSPAPDSCWVLDWTQRIWISYFSTKFPSARVQVWQTDNFHFSSFLGSPCKVFSLASIKLIPALSRPSCVSQSRPGSRVQSHAQRGVAEAEEGGHHHPGQTRHDTGLIQSLVHTANL